MQGDWEEVEQLPHEWIGRRAILAPQDDHMDAC